MRQNVRKLNWRSILPSLEWLEPRQLLSGVNVTCALTGPAGPVVAGAKMDFTATVSADNGESLDGDTVNLMDGSTVVQSATISQGTVAFEISASAGSHAYTAQFAPGTVTGTNVAYFAENDSYYQVVPTKLTWTQAEAAAATYTFAGRQGRLATITSSDENDFITNNVLTPNVGNGASFWLGAYQTFDGQASPTAGWQWITGEPFSYTNWLGSEPNGSGSDNHIEIYAQPGGQWNDLSESQSALSDGFLIEYAGDGAIGGAGSNEVDVTVSPQPVITIGVQLSAPTDLVDDGSTINLVAAFSTSDGSSLDGQSADLYCNSQKIATATIAGGQALFQTTAMDGTSIYNVELEQSSGSVFYFPATGTFYEAVKSGGNSCDAAQAAAAAMNFMGIQGRLVTITSAAENAFLFGTVVPKNSGDYWIGALQPPGSPEPAGGWEWMSGAPFVYTNWRSGEPNNFYNNTPNEDRILMDGSNGTWYDIPNANASFDSGGYIVEFPAGSSPSSGISNNITITGVPDIHAVERVTVNLSGPAAPVAAGSKVHFTVSASADDGSSLDGKIVTLFEDGAGNQQATLSHGTAVFTIAASSGTHSFYAQLASAGSSTGGIAYDAADDTYYECVAGNITWSQAEAAAAQTKFNGRQGELAIVTSAAEDAFLYNLMPGGWGTNIWLGGLQPPGSAEPAGGWQWVSGAPFNYTNWDAGQPDNYGNIENNLEMYGGSGGTWNDAPDALGANGYFIEFPPSEIIVGSASNLLSLDATPVSTLIKISAKPNAIAYGSATLLTATVTTLRGTPVGGGEVILRDLANNTVIDTESVNNHGVITFNLQGVSTGVDSYEADYEENDIYSAATSGSVSVNVSKAVPQMDVVSGGYRSLMIAVFPPRKFDQSLANPSGTVTLLDNGVPIQTQTCTGDFVPFDLSELPVGKHVLQFAYAGDDSFAATTSRSQTLVFTPPADTTTTLTADYLTPAVNDMVTFHATVAYKGRDDSTLQGTVNFYDGDELLGSADLAGRSATFSTSVTQAGEEDVHAEFVPSSNFQGSASAELSLQVKPPVQIDLLAVYSNQALTAAGSTESLFQMIQTYVGDTNVAMENSGIGTIVNLLALAPAEYNESGDYAVDLDHLSNAHDGVMDAIPTVRDQLGADLVVLLDSKGETHGQLITEGISTELLNPKSPGRDQDAFLVIDENAPEELYVLAHELGHTLGATHAVNDPDPIGATPYAHGYRFRGDDGQLYHDIMAYYPGTPIQYYSNPNITYEGVPIGNTSANASLVIRQDAPIVAAYRTVGPAGAIESVTNGIVTGYVLDAAATSALNVRIDVDGITQATIAADVERDDLTFEFGVPVSGFQYQLPALSQGKHTVQVYGIDPDSDAAVLMGSKTITA